MIIRLFLLLLFLLPMTVNAEIYKSKDSNGTVHYSDVPPPGNVPRAPLGAKIKIKPPSEPIDPAATDAALPSRESEAIKRQENAEKDKQDDLAKESGQQQKQQNCTAAKASMQRNKQGGRVYKINEKGEQEFLTDADLAKGIEQAQKEIDENCQ